MLLFAKFARYLLQMHSLLIARCKIRSLLVTEVARCKKSLVTCCKICPLLVAEVVHCKKSLVSKICSLLVPKIIRGYSLQNSFVCSLQKLFVIRCRNSENRFCGKFGKFRKSVFSFKIISKGQKNVLQFLLIIINY